MTIPDVFVPFRKSQVLPAFLLRFGVVGAVWGTVTIIDRELRRIMTRIANRAIWHMTNRKQLSGKS